MSDLEDLRRQLAMILVDRGIKAHPHLSDDDLVMLLRYTLDLPMRVDQWATAAGLVKHLEKADRQLQLQAPALNVSRLEEG